jgi:hypothetical protein
MRYAPLAIAATVVAFSSAVRAADDSGSYSYWGAGAITCEAYTGMAAAQNADFDKVSFWVGGYLTAYNRFTDKTYDIVEKGGNITSVTNWLTQYCKDHKGDLLTVAAEAFTTANKSKRQISHP